MSDLMVYLHWLLTKNNNEFVLPFSLVYVWYYHYYTGCFTSTASKSLSHKWDLANDYIPQTIQQCLCVYI